jgi:hypothetical protein
LNNFKIEQVREEELVDEEEPLMGKGKKGLELEEVEMDINKPNIKIKAH